jgi:uncharacterized membrane protein (DUF4010 family)
MTLPMALAGLGALGYGALFTLRAVQAPKPEQMQLGRPFRPRDALIFTVTISTVIFAAALLEHLFGTTGALVGVAVAGFADTQAAGASAASLAAAGRLSLEEAVVATLLAFSGNAAMKLVVSWVSGGAAFAWRILPGQVAMVALAWLGWALTHFKPPY